MPRRRRRIWASHDSVKLQSGETASLSGRAHPAADAGRIRKEPDGSGQGIHVREITDALASQCAPRLVSAWAISAEPGSYERPR